MKGHIMKVCKYFTGNFATLISICVFFLLFTWVPVLRGAERFLSWPSETGVMQSRTNGPLDAHELRKGRIALSPEILPKASGRVDRAAIAPSRGDDDTVSVSLFSDVSYDVTIESVKHHADGTMVVNGRLKDHTMGTVVMTVGSDGFFITVQDMKKGLLYRVKGDSRQGTGTVTEIDMKKMPPLVR